VDAKDDAVGGGRVVNAGRRQVAARFLDAVHRRDLDGLGGCLHPRVQLRVLQPGDVVIRTGLAPVVDRFSRWFDRWERYEPVRATAWEIADLLGLEYRLRVTDARGVQEIEQQLYCGVADGRIGTIDLLSSGFQEVRTRE
jgi:hypothetical protein